MRTLCQNCLSKPAAHAAQNADRIPWRSDHARRGVDSLESMQSHVLQHTRTLLTWSYRYARQFLLVNWHDWHFIIWWHWIGSNNSGAIQKPLLEGSSAFSRQFESPNWRAIEIERPHAGKLGISSIDPSRRCFHHFVMKCAAQQLVSMDWN